MNLHKLFDRRRRSHGEMVRLHAELLGVVNEYIASHLEWAADYLPRNSVISVELEGDDDFNEWSRRLVHSSAEPGQPILPMRFRAIESNHEKKFELDPAMFVERPIHLNRV
jgi:hypothetical protein